MPGKITKKFRLHSAKQFYEQFSEAAPSNLYFFISNPTAWPDDAIPPEPMDTTTETVYNVWDNMMALKKISPSEVSYAVPRIDWKTGTVYDQYTSETEFFTDNNFYVVTDDYHVYKCISNNSGGTSTVKPSGTSTLELTTGDGYVWKYLYTISASDALKFTTPNYIPVKTLTSDDGSNQWDVQAAAVAGAISTILVSNGGSGYFEHLGTVSSGGSGTTVLEVTASFTSNIYNGMTVYISSGTGAGQIKTITSYNGGTKTITVDSNFSPATDATSTYIISPKITVVGDGTNAKAYSRVTSTQISKVYVINNGSDYTKATATVSGGAGTGAVVVPQISPEGGHGKNAINELFGHNVIMNVKMTGAESNTFPVLNDFRTVGIIVDPIEELSGLVANNTSYRQTTKITLDNTSGTFTTDEVVTGGTSGATAKVVEYGDSTTLYVTGNKVNFTTSETITGSISAATATVLSKEEPNLTKYRGELIYLENRSPISRAADQQEDIKILIRF